LGRECAREWAEAPWRGGALRARAAACPRGGNANASPGVRAPPALEVLAADAVNPAQANGRETWLMHQVEGK
jgi:hypothetical protein